MATLKKKRKLATVKRDNHEDYFRINLSLGTNIARVNEDYISQISEKIEVRVTKKLSRKFIRAESWILGALLTLDDFLLNWKFCVKSVTVPDTSRTYRVGNQEYDEDRSQNDPHPEVGISVNMSPHLVNLDGDQVHHTFVSKIWFLFRNLLLLVKSIISSLLSQKIYQCDL